ncbi:MAG TPA: hypothetical protein VFV99_33895, partial [Kofleriaceae bacterium]|nr:hypothetical protein [Kofleriaceae bacterium]
STESNLDFDYLAFLQEVIDCAVVMVECDVALAAVDEKKRTREREIESQLTAVAEFGKRAAEFVGPVADQQAGSPAGRCAATIARAIRAAVESESAETKAKLAAERDELAKNSQGINTRAKEALEKLLRTHDLPGAVKELEVVRSGTGMKATMRQRTSFAVEAVLALEIPPTSLFTADLRVDRVAEGVEVHGREAGGWLKKSDKLVAHKLGRYQVVSVTVGAIVCIQLRAEGNGGELIIRAAPTGDMSIESTGGSPAKEVSIEERDRAGLRSLVEKLEAATRSLADARGNLVSIEIDGKPMADQANPRVLAERLTAAIGPTVQQINKHSRSDGELVLRRLIAGNRREEIFVPIADLVRKFEVLPAHARTVFSPLQLQGEPELKAPIVAKPVEAKPVDVKPVEVKPVDAKSVEVKSAPMVPMPERTTSRTSPPPIVAATLPPRTKEPTAPQSFAMGESKPPQPPPPAQVVDDDDDEWPSIARDEPSGAASDKGVPPPAK